MSTMAGDQATMNYGGVSKEAKTAVEVARLITEYTHEVSKGPSPNAMRNSGP